MLDKEMESHWIKGGHKELGKFFLLNYYTNSSATERLNDELDNYFQKAQATEDVGAKEDPKEEPKAEEAKE